MLRVAGREAAWARTDACWTCTSVVVDPRRVALSLSLSARCPALVRAGLPHHVPLLHDQAGRRTTAAGASRFFPRHQPPRLHPLTSRDTSSAPASQPESQPASQTASQPVSTRQRCPSLQPWRLRPSPPRPPLLIPSSTSPIQTGTPDSPPGPRSSGPRRSCTSSPPTASSTRRARPS